MKKLESERQEKIKLLTDDRLAEITKCQQDIMSNISKTETELLKTTKSIQETKSTINLINTKRDFVKKDYIGKVAKILALDDLTSQNLEIPENIFQTKLHEIQSIMNFAEYEKFSETNFKTKIVPLLETNIKKLITPTSTITITNHQLSMPDDPNDDYIWLLLLLTYNGNYNFKFEEDKLNQLIKMLYGDESNFVSKYQTIKAEFKEFLNRFTKDNIDLSMPYLSFEVTIKDGEEQTTVLFKSSPTGHLDAIVCEKGDAKISGYETILNYWKSIDNGKYSNSVASEKFANWLNTQVTNGKLECKDGNTAIEKKVVYINVSNWSGFEFKLFETVPVVGNFSEPTISLSQGVQVKNFTKVYDSNSGITTKYKDPKKSTMVNVSGYLFDYVPNKQTMQTKNNNADINIALKSLIKTQPNVEVKSVDLGLTFSNIPPVQVAPNTLTWTYKLPKVGYIEKTNTKQNMKNTYPNLFQTTTTQFLNQRNAFIHRHQAKQAKQADQAYILYSMYTYVNLPRNERNDDRRFKNSISIPLILAALNLNENYNAYTREKYDSEIAQTVDGIKLTFELLEPNNQYQQQLETLEKQLRELNQQKDKLNTDHANCVNEPPVTKVDDVSDYNVIQSMNSNDIYNKALAKINTEISTLEAKIAELSPKIQQAEKERDNRIIQINTDFGAQIQNIQKRTRDTMPDKVRQEIADIEKKYAEIISSHINAETDKYNRTRDQVESYNANREERINGISRVINEIETKIKALEYEIMDKTMSINNNKDEKIKRLKEYLKSKLRDCSIKISNKTNDKDIEFYKTLNYVKIEEIQRNATIICSSDTPYNQCKIRSKVDSVQITMKTIIDKVKEIIDHMFLEKPIKALFWKNLLENGKYYGIQNPADDEDLNEIIEQEMEILKKSGINYETITTIFSIKDWNQICNLMGEISKNFLTPLSGNNRISYLLQTINLGITENNQSNKSNKTSDKILQESLFNILTNRGFKLLEQKTNPSVSGGGIFLKLSNATLDYNNKLYIGDNYDPLNKDYNFKNTDFHDFLVETMKKIRRTLTLYQSIEPICSHRLKEGKFINKSLENLRLNFNDIMAVKNRNTVFYSPEFYTDCLSDYCPSKTRCFTGEKSSGKIDDLTFSEYMKMKKDNKPVFTSIIIDWIFYNYVTSMFGKLDKYKPIQDGGEPTNTQRKQALQLIINKMKKFKVKDFYEKMLIAVFCVFNVSCYRNNTPALAFIDSNALKIIYYKYKDLYNRKCYINNQTEFIRQKTCVIDKIQEIINNISKKDTNDVFNKYYGTLDAALFSISGSTTNFLEKFNQIKDTFLGLRNESGNGENKQSRPFDNDESIVIESFIQRLDTYNEATPIGTIQFLDKIAKLNTTNVICDASLASPCLEKKANIDRDFVMYGLYNEVVPNMCQDSQLKPFIKTQIDSTIGNNIIVTLNHQSYTILERSIHLDPSPILFIPIINKATIITGVEIYNTPDESNRGEEEGKDEEKEGKDEEKEGKDEEKEGKDEEKGEVIKYTKPEGTTKPDDETYVVKLFIDPINNVNMEDIIGMSITIEYTSPSEILSIDAIANVDDAGEEGGGGDDDQKITEEIGRVSENLTTNLVDEFGGANKQEENGGNIHNPELRSSEAAQHKERVRSYMNNMKQNTPEIIEPEPNTQEEYPLVNRSIRRQSSKGKKNKTYKYSAEESAKLSKPLIINGFKNEEDDEEEEDDNSPKTEEYSKTGKTKKQRVKVRGKTDKNKNKINIK